jgi:hypothetical protein
MIIFGRLLYYITKIIDSISSNSHNLFRIGIGCGETPGFGIIRHSYGSLFVDFTLSEQTFTGLDINFTPSKDSLIENTKILATKTKTRTTMRITNKDASAVQ